MLHMVKLAAANVSSSQSVNDVVKTAGILSMLKNKIHSIFSKNKKEKINQLKEETSKFKHLLSAAYEKIKKVEQAINDLDLDKYKYEVSELKIILTKLSTELSLVKSTENESVKNEEKESKKVKTKTKDTQINDGTSVPSEQPNDSSGPSLEDVNDGKQKGEKINGLSYKARKNSRPRDNILPQMAVDLFFSDGKLVKDTTLRSFGVTLDDIKINSNVGIKPIYASMALCEIIKNGEKNSDLLLHNQKLMDDKKIADLLYPQMIDWKIESVLPRELNNSGKKKFGNYEVSIVGPFIPLPSPFENYEIKPKFVLVNNQKTELDKLTFVLYRQLLIKVINNDRQVIEPNAANLMDYVTPAKLPGYNAPPNGKKEVIITPKSESKAESEISKEPIEDKKIEEIAKDVPKLEPEENDLFDKSFKIHKNKQIFSFDTYYNKLKKISSQTSFDKNQLHNILINGEINE